MLAGQANPYLEALPPLATMREMASQIGHRPHHSDAERGLRQVERRFCVMRLRQAYFPAARHIRFAEGIDMLVRSGYEGRDPSGHAFTRRQHKLARRERTFLDMPPRPLGCDSGAGSGFLIGAPGMGKTRTVEQVLRRYPQTTSIAELPTQVSWLKLECPEGGSIRSLCLQYFEELSRVVGTSDYSALLAPRKASDDDLMNRMASVASFHGLGLLVIDEIQNIGRFVGEEHRLMTFLTQLTNQLGIPVLFMGTLSVLGQVQKTGRIARRAVGPACAVWEPLAQDREWRSLLDQVWHYQWTSEETPLDDELADTIYELTGGILDLMVKLCISAQLRLIYRSEVSGASDEIITPAFLRSVAEADFAPVRSIVQALLDGDKSRIRRFDDMHAFDRGYWGAIEQVIDQPIIAGGNNMRVEIKVPDGDHYQLVWSKLQSEGLGDDVILALVDEARAQGHDATADPLGFFEIVRKLSRARKARKKKKAPLDPTTLEANDLRRIVAEAGEGGLTPFEAMKGAGLIGIWSED